ncbi:phosphoenolpyruvate carboxykinase (atp) signature [Lucifera butyrica]|uniref:Phosphoenolpyruvate carboxykinase (ATP) n=1 Tax=Lucifera butyrica TaxID=1351585 RepID=A0A498RBQ0_9FIRM|nr:phosphoenolpyruvate carboxykinase (ATP) [Lucifera butyrica]VBB08669.1 phosphoenolpyruvate carboxykinase (atp) signature [Lucifera butyrica]
MATSVWYDLRQKHTGIIHINLPIPRLVELSLQHGEGHLTESGALRVSTGKYTGRSPNDKFIVDTPSVHDEIWWGNNQSVSEEAFGRLYHKVLDYLGDKELFVFNGFAGADRQHSLPVRIINELAWHNLFVQQLFLRPEDTGWPVPEEAGFTVLCAPGFQAVPDEDGTNSEAFVILHFEQKLILIGGTYYAGEMKKSIFSILNYLLPRQGTLSMHCSANQGSRGDVALFFGLSGTGKTSLSADPERFLIGDDEHGWNDNGVFNFEGGCYAKCIHLTYKNEPQIWDAIKFGTVLENVVFDEQKRSLDFNSEEITENTRAAYPVSYIPGSIYPGTGGHPETILFLTADAFGVLPPVVRLSPDQAMYYFLSGYTSKLAGTERGVTEPQATFSACFGSPFLPLSPVVYANLLKDKIAAHKTRVFLINTGWQGGPYGIGKRISIQHTRQMVSAAMAGALDQVCYTTHPVFNLSVPLTCPGVPADILQPQTTWSDPKAYEIAALKLAAMFHKNFANFAGMPATISAAGPFPGL